jgi:hypothetical protein
MTTPSPFLAWHAEAERLIEQIADRSWQAATNRAAGSYGREQNCMQSVTAARAALSAHLLAVPNRPAPVLQSATVNGVVVYTKPEGMA